MSLGSYVYWCPDGCGKKVMYTYSNNRFVCGVCGREWNSRASLFSEQVRTGFRDRMPYSVMKQARGIL